MSKLTDVLKDLPMIGAAVATGNIPGLLTVASKTVGDVLGKKVTATPDAIADAIAGATPEQIAALKIADNNFQLSLLQTDAGDRDSARKREETVKGKTVPILAFGTIILSFFFEGIYIFHGIGGNVSPELVGRILGGFDAARMLILAYYFGSSDGADWLRSKFAGAK